MNAAHPPGENQFNLRKIVVDFLRVWTAIFYAYNSVLQQSVPQRIQSAVIPHMYSYAPPPTGSDGCSTSSSSPGKYIIQFLLVPPPTGSRGSVNYFNVKATFSANASYPSSSHVVKSNVICETLSNGSVEHNSNFE